MRTLSSLALALVMALLSGCNKELVCPVGEVDCGGRCVSLLSDAANCGACGTACGALEACSAGTCDCAPGVAVCDGACTDLARDPQHCGACETACGAADYCTTQGDVTACTDACPSGFTACARTCVELGTDRLHCGACGNACGAGESCRDGGCRADVFVACYATGDVRPVTLELAPAGAPRLSRGAPTALAMGSDVLYTANGFPAGVGIVPIDARLPTSLTVLPGDDLQYVTAHAGAVLASNSGVGTLVVLDAAGEVLDEIVLPGAAPNPHGVAVAGSTAYVALYGNGPLGDQTTPTGQTIAKVDLSGLAECAKPALAAPACGAGGACAAGRECRDGRCRARCGEVTGTIDVLAVPGSFDAPGYPFPNQVATVGSRVFVTLSNAKFADFGGGFAGYFAPAGNGRLLVIDTAANDATSIVDLGPGCKNAGDLAVLGSTVWVACGSFSFATEAPGTIVPVDVSGAPTVGAAVDATAIVPGNLAFCGGRGYVTDQSSGKVLPFDPSSRGTGTAVEVCPLNPVSSFAWASDIACSE
ncbi:MAG TPA: MXAN_6577-like cysteine-rich protein [Anaeromyxobacter sp.]|nr:MXAN_6577-like cysteine-rich protein [Anaeromyxobacter sp.]